ncbi:Eco57I restriction-modification methylase domain-containing protein [Flavobacterium sp. TSSA_36]|uniref:Eco57I restriction-modification methylase domain-containing protein n=1 Tax=Flavobacterium sp. TSSA_36 TaxID=3447669 RepID=UPI003F31B174
MPLFQNSVVAKYLKTQDKTHLTKQWNDFKNHFHNPTIQENIRNSKEEQYQEGFLRDLFVKILGYSLNPDTNFNLTTEYKNVKDSKKADGAILIDDKVKAVIELKGTNTTDLGKIETQAFGYKNNQPDCVYVITSNFEKIRFYIDNAIEHIEFNLFTLTEADFDLLYLCLAFENISKNIAKKIKDESVSEEDVITKKLYKDYSLFKRELHQNLVQLNPEFDPLDLFKKSQKLLDRFLFLFFGEDRHLLPPNSVRLILAQWKQLQELDEYTPLYDRFKKYFGYLNTGYKGKQYDVYAYNGGLFKPDEILDSIKIDDDLLYTHTLKLSEYDFASEVDVNILGHIFENSLNELDEIKAQLEGTDIDKTKTKRKKDGVFYTPKYITKYIVENTIGKLCEEKKVALVINDEDYFATKEHAPLPKKKKQELLEKLDTYRKWLLQLTICDPACGSGAFLNQALDFLIEEHQYIDELQAKLFGDALVLTDMENSILENNLFGVDLNEESVEIAKLSLWLRTAQPNRKLNDLSGNIKCGNSLIDDPEVAGDKAFSWKEAFPQVFKEKQKKPFHITTAIHDSRTSQRMIDYKVRENRALGTMPEPQVNYLTDDDEMVIAETVSILAKELQLNIVAFNVCKDHIHIVLVCEEDEIDEIVRKIKGRTAREVNKNNGINPVINKDYNNELYNNGLEPIVKESTGAKSVPLWTQKFGCKAIVDQNQLQNTIAYVKNNREKHNLPPHSNKGFKPLVESIACSHEHAFRAEYKGGFDVIIGNPPYVVYIKSIVGNSTIDYIIKNYKYAEYNPNTYALFTELGTKILKTNGFLGFIIPNSWMQNKYFSNMRDFVYGLQVNEIVYLKNTAFQEIVETVVLIFENRIRISDKIKLTSEIVEDKFIFQTFDIQKYKNGYNPFIETTDSIIDKMNIQKSLKNYAIIYRGLETKDNQKWIVSNKLDDNHKPILLGKDVNKYSTSYSGSYVNFIKKEMKSNANEEYYNRAKIFMRRTGSYIIADIDLTKAMALKNLYLIIPNDEDNIYSIVAQLNSKLFNYYHKAKSSGENKAFAQFTGEYIESFPYNINDDFNIKFKNLVQKITSSNSELIEQSQKFQRTLQRKFELTDLPKKLQDWYLLSYGEFIKELGKKKIKLSLSQEAEWEDYFSQEQQKAVALKQQIDTTDAAIDQMVYALYGLTEEEIAIVENS